MLGKNISQEKSPATDFTGARKVYTRLLESPIDQTGRSESRDFLERQLAQAATLSCDMPEDPRILGAWMESRAGEVGQEYRRYREARKAGAPRRYFTGKAHALWFLQGVAPTKLVDGAWLYGTLQHWEDPRFRPLIRTYLEELGEGHPDRNHVVLYRQLLAEHGCDHLPRFSDAHYVQGAVQLALAYNAPHYLPELIGYNLGYEQLPLHLLITAFELNELDIDPYYFTLHVTVDNGSTGHARKAIEAVTGCCPKAGNPQVFLQRVANGYRLNELGLGTTDVIARFDPEEAVVDMLEGKALFGQHLHSDFSTIGGRTVNEWLSSPGQVRYFLSSLQAEGWIKRDEDPRHSRFWRLIEGPRAQMAGVFSEFERQLLFDWIAGDWTRFGAVDREPHRGNQPSRKRRAFQRFSGTARNKGIPQVHSQSRPGDLDRDIRDLERELEQLPSPLRMQRFISLMAPSSHATEPGLFATRQFAAALR